MKNLMKLFACVCAVSIVMVSCFAVSAEEVVESANVKIGRFSNTTSASSFTEPDYFDPSIIVVEDEEEQPAENEDADEQEAVVETPVTEEEIIIDEIDTFEVTIYIVDPQFVYRPGDMLRIQSEIVGNCASPAYQWQVLDAENPDLGWVNIEGATADYYEFAIDETNFNDNYRVVVTDTSVVAEEDEAAEEPADEQTEVEETEVPEESAEEPAEETIVDDEVVSAE